MKTFVTGYRPSRDSYQFTVYCGTTTYCIVNARKGRSGIVVSVISCVRNGEVSKDLKDSFQDIVDKYPFPPNPTFKHISEILRSLMESNYCFDL